MLIFSQRDVQKPDIAGLSLKVLLMWIRSNDLSLGTLMRDEVKSISWLHLCEKYPVSTNQACLSFE